MFKHLLYNHLANSFWIGTYLVFTFAMLSGLWGTLFVMLLIVFGLSFIFRENIEEKVIDVQEPKLSLNVPAIGIVKELGAMSTISKIEIDIPPYGPFGIHAPAKAEIQNVTPVAMITRPGSISEEDWHGLNLHDRDYVITLKTISGMELWLVLKKNIFPPFLTVRTGDRCTKGACLGIMPFGGRILLLMPLSMGTLVERKQMLNSINIPVSVAKGD